MSINLYRCTSRFMPDGIHRNTYLHSPRKPVDTPKNIHEISDNWFAEHFGSPARSQAIFCSTNMSQAKDYLSPNGSCLKVTLPSSVDYQLIFSENVYDFTEIVGDVGFNPTEQEVRGWLEKMHYKSVSDIQSLPYNFNGEVMLISEIFEVINIE